MLHSSSINLGDLYNAEVVAVKDVGLSLMIDSRVQAFCPISLISDAATMDVSKLKKKFKVGQVIRVRVWQKEGNSIVVTNKKSIVELEDSKCIYSYDEATVGKQSTGSVKDIKPEGIAVQFFNKVRSMTRRGSRVMTIMVYFLVLIRCEDSFLCGCLCSKGFSIRRSPFV